MADVSCAKCGEPWDYYGVKNGDMDASESSRFLKGEGCPCCGFGTYCHMCGGTGKTSQGIHRASCNCMDGKVLIWQPSRSGYGYSSEHWYTGYKPNVKTMDDDTLKIIRRDKGFESRDGWVNQAWAVCQECKGDLPPCDACDGTGKLNATKEDQEDLAFDAMRSECSASDEDPFDIMTRRGIDD